MNSANEGTDKSLGDSQLGATSKGPVPEVHDSQQTATPVAAGRASSTDAAVQFSAEPSFAELMLWSCW